MLVKQVGGAGFKTSNVRILVNQLVKWDPPVLGRQGGCLRGNQVLMQVGSLGSKKVDQYIER